MCTYTEIFRYIYVIEHYISQIENIQSLNIEYVQSQSCIWQQKQHLQI